MRWEGFAEGLMWGTLRIRLAWAWKILRFDAKTGCGEPWCNLKAELSLCPAGEHALNWGKMVNFGCLSHGRCRFAIYVIPTTRKHDGL